MTLNQGPKVLTISDQRVGDWIGWMTSGVGVEISQELFVDDLLEKAQMTRARPSYTPASPAVVLTRADCPTTG